MNIPSELPADWAAALELTPYLGAARRDGRLTQGQYARALALFLMALKPGRYDRRSTCQP